MLSKNYIFSQNELGSWNTTNFNFKLNDKWQVFAETQLRSLKFYDNFHYYEFKAGAMTDFCDYFAEKLELKKE